MKKKIHKSSEDSMLKEYDFSKGVRGKYASRYKTGNNVIVLDPDIASVFKDSKSVNRVLRPIVGILQQKG